MFGKIKLPQSIIWKKTHLIEFDFLLPQTSQFFGKKWWMVKNIYLQKHFNRFHFKSFLVFLLQRLHWSSFSAYIGILNFQEGKNVFLESIYHIFVEGRNLASNMTIIISNDHYLSPRWTLPLKIYFFDEKEKTLPNIWLL